MSGTVENEPSTRSRLAAILCTLAAVPVLYVLGIGPAAVFERRILYISSGRSGGDAFILKFYQPLWETATRLGVRVPLYSYCLWWCKSLRFLDQPLKK